MKSGQLRHLVNIEHNTGATDDGFGNMRPNFTALYSNVPVQVQQIGSREQWSAERIASRSSHRIYSRYLPGLDTSQRIIWGSRTFTIDGIITDEKLTKVEILATEQV